MSDGATHKEIAKHLNDIQYKFKLSTVKVTAKENLDQIQIEDYSIPNVSSGDTIDLPVWVASVLQERNLVEFNEDSLDVEIFRLINRERIQKTPALSEIKDDFYFKLNTFLTNSKINLKQNPEFKNEHDKLYNSALDLVNIRIKKIVSLASLSTHPEDLTIKLTPEEQFLFNDIKSTIAQWRNLLIGDSND